MDYVGSVILVCKNGPTIAAKCMLHGHSRAVMCYRCYWLSL